MSQVLDLLAEYRTRLGARDLATQRDLTRRWLRIQDSLQDSIELLVREMADLRAAGQPVTRWQLNQLDRYQSLLRQVDTETRQFARYAGGRISREQYEATQDGLEWGAESVRTLFTEASLAAPRFDILDVPSVNAMIGFGGDGAPLVELLRRSYPETVEAITDTLVRSTALGYNPRKTAKLMQDAMAGNLQRALVVARTEQGRALRVGTVREYQNTGVVQTYTRHASRSGRTCMACLLEDGRQYPVTVQFSDHPNGRCFALSDIAGVPSPFTETGREWLEAQPAEMQRQIMGDGHYEAWKAGEFRLEDAARMHSHPVWGEAPQVVPLRELTTGVAEVAA